MALKHWEKKLKGIGLTMLAGTAPRPVARPTELDLKSVRKILVIRLDDRIGNAVLLTPFLVALKDAFSEARVHLLISQRLKMLSDFLPSVDEFIFYDKRQYANRPYRLRKLLKQLRTEEFDLVIDASDELELSFNHALTTAFSGGRFRVGYDRRGSSRWLEVAVAPGDPIRHAVEMHLDLLRALRSITLSSKPAV